MRSISITVFITTFSILLLSSCSKNEASPAQEKLFCTLVQEEEFDQTGVVINNYLESTNPNPDLEDLVSWLNSMQCVSSATIICDSCIETFPPQSELEVEFKVNGKRVTKVMDILMDDPLRFLRYH